MSAAGEPLRVRVHYDFASTLCYVAHRALARLEGRISALGIELAWTPLDLAKIPNSKNLLPQFVGKYPDGKVSGIGAVSWYITLVTNTKVYPQAPTSWQALWDPANKDKLGLLALVSNSFLLEVTATVAR